MMWKQEADLLRSMSEAAPNLPSPTDAARPFPHSTVPERRAHSPAADAARTRQLLAGSSGFSWLSFHWIELTKELTGRISSLPPAAACQGAGAAARSPSWCSAGSTSDRLQAVTSRPGRCIPQQGGVSANLLLALERLQSRVGVQALPLPPSPGRIWLHTDPGRWLISSQLEVKGCQSLRAAPRQWVRGSLQPGWQH